ncbi:MAG: hypothetical protein J7556_22250 [Acidovorax sp.]|nr:hypothetical protein [Acidovorax sp.]
MAYRIDQQPRDVRDYDLDFGEFFPADDTVVSAQVVVEPAVGLTVNYAIQHPRVKVWIQDGVDGAAYKVTVVAYTNDGRAKEVELAVRIKDK